MTTRPHSPGDLDDARALIEQARSVVVLTGAGVSAESGVPTFRGAGGLWKQYRAEELATAVAFARDPRLVWEWYGWRRGIVASCEPNAAHRALARWCAGHPDARIVTQNVDDLHDRAARAEGGAHERAMPLHLHGSLFRARCIACGREDEHRGAIDATDAGTLPRCGACRALLRPAVVWFGENLDERVLSEAFTRAERADVCLVVGTSGVVQPAASLAAITARAGGAVIEVNLEPTPITPLARIALHGPAAAIVPALVDPHARSE